MAITIECPKCGHTRIVDFDAIRTGSWRAACPVCHPAQPENTTVADSPTSPESALSVDLSDPEREGARSA